MTIPTTLTPELEALMARLHRACLTVSTWPPAGPRGLPSRWSVGMLDWSAVRREWMDRGNEASMLTDADITRRFIAPPDFAASPKEHDDALPALALLEPAPPIGKATIRLRAFQLWYGQHAAADEQYAHWRGGWRRIGRLCGVSYEKARKAHWEAVCTAYEQMLQRAA